jgi:HK97 family phage portal protein
MGLVARIKHAVEAFKAPGDPANLWRSTGSPVLTPARGSSEMLDEYGRNTQLQSPVDRIAMDLAGVQWRVLRVDPTSPEDETRAVDVTRTSDLGRLIRHPSSDFSWPQLMQILATHMELLGEAFLILDAPSAAPSEMLPVPPTWVVRRPSLEDQTFAVTMYGRSLQQTMTLPASQVLWFRRSHPRDPWVGLGKAFAVDDELQQYSEANKFNRSIFLNGSFPGAMVSIKGLGPQEQKRFQSDFESRFGGYRNHGKPLVVGADVSVMDLSKSQRDMDFVALLKFIRDTSGQNWNIPPELLGIVENSNRASIDSAMYIHAVNNLEPRLRMWRAELQRQLVSRFGDSTLDLVYVSPVRETAEFVLAQTNEGLTRGALTVNEWRKRNGFPALEDGDVRLVPSNTAPDGMLANQAPGAPQVAARGVGFYQEVASWK